MLRCRRIEVRAGGALAYTHPMVHTHAPFRGLSVGNCHTCHQVSIHRSSFQARRCTCLWKGSIFGSLGATFHALARPADASDIPSRGESFPRTTLTYPSAYGWRFTRTQGARESKLLDRVTAPRHRFRAALFGARSAFGTDLWRRCRGALTSERAQCASVRLAKDAFGGSLRFGRASGTTALEKFSSNPLRRLTTERFVAQEKRHREGQGCVAS